MRSPDDPDRPPTDRLPAGAGSSLIPLTSASRDETPTVITPHRPIPPADPSLGLAPGSRLGHFELIEAVGAGGMAAVLKARDLELNRVVALKILPPNTARDPEAVARFKHEARAAAKLDHDNVARAFFCGEDQGLHFIAFEFVEGDNLRVLIERRGPLPAGECVRYMAQVAAGLAHAADRGVVHRDIKPSNIVVTPDGKAKIVDMGLARHTAQSVNGGVTQSGVTLGTFDYISPEQALDPRRADIRSDLYSLGCAFYHALTGRPPVPEGTAARKLQAHQNDPVTDPRVLNPSVPDELAAVLSRMMAKRPEDRYQTPADLIAALAAVARSLGLPADAVAVDPALWPADPSSVRLLPAPPRVPVGLLAGVVALAVAVAVLVSLSGPARSPVASLDPPPTKATPAEPTPAPPAGVASVAASGVAATADELVRLLESPTVSEVRLVPGAVYDLSARPKGVAVTGPGRRLTVEAAPGPGGGDPPVVRVAAVPPTPAGTGLARPGSLTLAKFESVQFRGVRFEVAEGPPADEVFDRPLGLVVADALSVEFVGCRFAPHGTLETADVAGVAVTRDPREARPTTFKATRCYFGLRRGVAVQLAGPIKAEVTESGFAPHPAAFALDDPDDADPTAPAAASELVLRHCTFLLDKGAVVEAGDGVRWQVTAGACVFAGVPPNPADAMAMTPERLDRRSAVVRVTGARSDVRFAAVPNSPSAAYRTDVPADADPALVLDLKQQPPWESADPVGVLDTQEPWAAFRLKTSLPQLRRPGGEGIVGAVSAPTGVRIYAAWPLPPLTSVAGGPAARVWWPGVEDLDPERRPANAYETLAQAVAALKAGEELHLRFDGERLVGEVLFERKFPVTVRPYPGARPVLALDPGDRIEPALFKLMDGELTLDGLEFRLKVKAARPGDVRAASVVTVVGGRACTLRNCVVTLDELDDERAAAVVLADPTGVMAAAADRRTEVKVQRCLVRGKGRLVWVPVARSFDLEVSHTVAALGGPVVAIDAPAKAAVPGAAARVKLDHVTAALGGPVLDLRPGRRPAGWVPVAVDAERCVFAAVDRGVPLAALDGDPAMLGTAFTWSGSGNWYANYPAAAAFVEVTAADEAGDPRRLDAEAWFAFTAERAEQSAGPVTFAAFPKAGRKLTGVTADKLTVTDVMIGGATAGDAGADAKQVARPADER